MVERKVYVLGDEALGLVIQRMNQPVKIGGPGDGGGDSGIPSRLAKVEAAVEHIKSDVSHIKTDIRDIKSEARTDFRILFGAIIFVALGLAGLMAKGFKWL